MQGWLKSTALLFLEEKMSGIIRLSPEQFRKVKALVRKKCCNHEAGGECSLLGDKCPQLLSPSLMCRWCKSAIVPLDKSLSFELFGTEGGLIKTACEKCGKSFVKTGNRQKLCPNCAEKVRSANRREYNRRSYLAKKHKWFPRKHLSFGGVGVDRGIYTYTTKLKKGVTFVNKNRFGRIYTCKHPRLKKALDKAGFKPVCTLKKDDGVWWQYINSRSLERALKEYFCPKGGRGNG